MNKIGHPSPAMKAMMVNEDSSSEQQATGDRMPLEVESVCKVSVFYREEVEGKAGKRDNHDSVTRV